MVLQTKFNYYFYFRSLVRSSSYSVMINKSTFLLMFFSATVCLFHRFKLAKFVYSGSILNLSQFFLLPLSSNSKVIKINSKIIILLPCYKSVKRIRADYRQAKRNFKILTIGFFSFFPSLRPNHYFEPDKMLLYVQDE